MCPHDFGPRDWTSTHPVAQHIISVHSFARGKDFFFGEGANSSVILFTRWSILGQMTCDDITSGPRKDLA